MSVVVLSKASGFCPACNQTVKFLTVRGIPFKEIKVDKDSSEFVKVSEETGTRNVPIILPNGLDNLDGMFTGFRPDKLRKLVRGVS